jgi:ribonucleotide monophosphatase NagD (HAD superfamily)
MLASLQHSRLTVVMNAQQSWQVWICSSLLSAAGKPNKPAYEIAAKKLQAQLDALAKEGPKGEQKSHKLKHVYAVGDNPKSDVRGANSAGNIWRSILVCTGVYKGGVKSNDKEDPAHYVVDGVGEAVDKVFEIEKQRSLGRAASQELDESKK